MAESWRLYYITDRTGFPGDERARQRRVLDKIAEAAACGVDYIQLREKDLSARELESLAREAMTVIRELKAEKPELKAALLINSRMDVALASGSDGVHLRSEDVSPQDVQMAWKTGEGNWRARAFEPVIGISCHSAEEVSQAARSGATFAVFGPVFGKQKTAPAGLDGLREASCVKIPVLALGGVTMENAASCLDVGAAGIAGIRLFQENDIAAVVRVVRGIRQPPAAE
jgi:thiamine-phosphate pyrophosphorylase